MNRIDLDLWDTRAAVGSIGKECRTGQGIHRPEDCRVRVGASGYCRYCSGGGCCGARATYGATGGDGRAPAAGAAALSAMLTSRARWPTEGFDAATRQDEGSRVVCRSRGCSCSHVPGQPQSTLGCILHGHRIADTTSRNWLNGKCAFCEPVLVSDAPPPRQRAFAAPSGAEEPAASPAAIQPVVRNRSKWEAKYYEEEMKRKDLEKRLQRIEDILVAKRAHLDTAQASATRAAVAQHAAEQAELIWKQKFEEEQAARLAIEAVRNDLESARDTAIADKAEAEERAVMAEEAAARSRSLWVAASWRSAFDRKLRDEARAMAAASAVACEQAQVASAADRQARLHAEELSRADKREREQAEERARLDRQSRAEAEQRASAEAAERMGLVEQLARATAAETAAIKEAEESAALVSAADARASAAKAAEAASTTAANDATTRCNAAEARAATAAVEVARLNELLGTASAATQDAVAAQEHATAVMSAQVEAECALRAKVEAELVEAVAAQEVLQQRIDDAAKNTWQIAMLRTQIDALRKVNEQVDAKYAEATRAREEAEIRLRDAVSRTAAAEERIQHAEDEAAAARAELAPLKVAAAEALAKADAADARCNEEMKLRIAAETERRRRIDRVRRAREKSQTDSGLSVDSSVRKQRKKKLEKGVSTYMAARLLRMPKVSPSIEMHETESPLILTSVDAARLVHRDIKSHVLHSK